MISEQWDVLWARLHGSPFILPRHIRATTVEGICQDCNITRVPQLGQNVVVSTSPNRIVFLTVQRVINGPFWGIALCLVALLTLDREDDR